MDALIITIPFSILLAGFFIGMFIWSSDNGQFDDVEKNKNIVFNDPEDHKKKKEE